VTDNPVMTQDEAAEYLRIPASTLKGWRGKGYGPAGFMAGKHLRYRRSDIDAWIDAQAAGVNGKV
jgi:excisionase family DNA binding protein